MFTNYVPYKFICTRSIIANKSLHNSIDVKEEIGNLILEVDCVRRENCEDFTVEWAVSLLKCAPWPQCYSVISSLTPRYRTRSIEKKCFIARSISARHYNKIHPWRTLLYCKIQLWRQMNSASLQCLFHPMGLLCSPCLANCTLLIKS